MDQQPLTLVTDANQREWLLKPRNGYCYPVEHGIPILRTGLAGSMGAKLAARLLPNDTYEIVVQILDDIGSVCSNVKDILNKDGKIVDYQEDASIIEIKGVVGSGFLKMNPAVVTVSLYDAGAGKIQVTIQGSAKEAIIKQYPGKKAAERLAEQLISIHS